MKRIFLALLIGIIFLSCEKGNDQIIERNNTGLLSKVFISGTAYMEYTYTSSGLIYEEKSWGGLHQTHIQLIRSARKIGIVC